MHIMFPPIFSESHIQWARDIESATPNSVVHIKGWHNETTYFALHFALWAAVKKERKVFVMVRSMSYAVKVWWRMLHMECVNRGLREPQANTLDFEDAEVDNYRMAQELSKNLMVWADIQSRVPKGCDLLIVDSIVEMCQVPVEWTSAIPKVAVLWEGPKGKRPKWAAPEHPPLFHRTDVSIAEDNCRTLLEHSPGTSLRKLIEHVDEQPQAINAVGSLTSFVGIARCSKCTSDYTAGTACIMLPCKHIVCFPCSTKALGKGVCGLCKKPMCKPEEFEVESLAKMLRIAQDEAAVHDVTQFVESANCILLVVADTELSPEQRDVLAMFKKDDQDRPVVQMGALEQDANTVLDRCVVWHTWSSILLSINGIYRKTPQMEKVTHVVSVGLGEMDVAMLQRLPLNKDRAVQHLRQ